MNDQNPKCGSPKKQSEGTCKNPAGFRTAHPGEGRCYLHGGGSPRGSESPHFKHGLYSSYMSKSLRAKAEAMEATLEILPELMLLRAVLAEYLSRFQELNGFLLTGDDIEVIRRLADTIRKTSDSMVRQRNSTALTAVEIALLADKIPQLVVKYVQGVENQRQFIAELFNVVPTGREGFEEPSLPSGVIAHPGRAK